MKTQGILSILQRHEGIHVPQLISNQPHRDLDIRATQEESWYLESQRPNLGVMVQTDPFAHLNAVKKLIF